VGEEAESTEPVVDGDNHDAVRREFAGVIIPAGAEREAAAVNPHECRQTAFATARRAFPVAMSVIHA